MLLEEHLDDLQLPGRSDIAREELPVHRMRAVILTHQAFLARLKERLAEKEALRKLEEERKTQSMREKQRKKELKEESKQRREHRAKESETKKRAKRQRAEERDRNDKINPESPADALTLERLRTEKPPPPPKKRETPCAECGVGWHAMQTTSMSEENDTKYCWHQCLHCKQWWCPFCLGNNGVNVHQRTCKNKRAKTQEAAPTRRSRREAAKTQTR